MKRPSTEGGAGRVNGRTAPRIARAKVVALGARHERRKPVPAADLAIATFLHRLLGDVTAGADLDRVLAAIVQGAAHLCGVQMAAQRTIARLLIADKTHKQIAEATGLSSRTVGHYVERLKLRCGASTMHGIVGSLLRGT